MLKKIKIFKSNLILSKVIPSGEGVRDVINRFNGQKKLS
jgi:hypothetical protein